jgi:hypothetical protein
VSGQLLFDSFPIVLAYLCHIAFCPKFLNALFLSEWIFASSCYCFYLVVHDELLLQFHPKFVSSFTAQSFTCIGSDFFDMGFWFVRWSFGATPVQLQLSQNKKHTSFLIKCCLCLLFPCYIPSHYYIFFLVASSPNIFIFTCRSACFVDTAAHFVNTAPTTVVFFQDLYSIAHLLGQCQACLYCDSLIYPSLLN